MFLSQPQAVVPAGQRKAIHKETKEKKNKSKIIHINYICNKLTLVSNCSLTGVIVHIFFCVKWQLWFPDISLFSDNTVILQSYCGAMLVIEDKLFSLANRSIMKK